MSSQVSGESRITDPPALDIEYLKLSIEAFLAQKFRELGRSKMATCQYRVWSDENQAVLRHHVVQETLRKVQLLHTICVRKLQ